MKCFEKLMMAQFKTQLTSWWTLSSSPYKNGSTDYAISSVVHTTVTHLQSRNSACSSWIIPIQNTDSTQDYVLRPLLCRKFDQWPHCQISKLSYKLSLWTTRESEYRWGVERLAGGLWKPKGWSWTQGRTDALWPSQPRKWPPATSILRWVWCQNTPE